MFTDGGGAVTLQLPANVNGLGYVCYSRVGQDRPLPTRSNATTQDFEGAADLDILPAMNGNTITAGRIWCAANSPITASLAADRSSWNAASKIDLTIVGPDAAQKTLAITPASPAAAKLQTNATQEGFYALQVAASALPGANSSPAYQLSVTYSAPQTFIAPVPAPSPQVVGQWDPVFKLANVAIHAHLLPTGKVLYWGRRKTPGDPELRFTQ